MTGEQRDKRAGRGGGQGRRPIRQFADSEFINAELSAEQVIEFRSWRSDLDDVCNVWAEVLEEGYRVNTKYDSYSSSCAAFIIPDEGSDNAGYILTGRGGNPYRAVSEALYKHKFMLSGGWASYVDRPRQTDDPDF